MKSQARNDDIAQVERQPACHLEVDGVKVAIEAVIEANIETATDEVCRFRIALPASDIRIVSHAARPSDLAATDDERMLGVGLTGIGWDGEAALDVPIASPLLFDGFHPLETDDIGDQQWRWTSGNAGLPPAHVPRWRGDAFLHLSLKTWRGNRPPRQPRMIADLLDAFENLGEDCEFGLCQRHFGLEPALSLLRFAGTDPGRLVSGLDNGFAGIDTPSVTDLVWNAQRAEYQFVTPYLSKSIGWRARMTPREVADLHQAGLLSLRLLRRKLLQDIAAARRIFVFKTREPALDAEARRLHAALQSHGPAALLWVSLAGGGRRGGEVVRLDDGLYRGFVDRFGIPHGPFDQWIRLCATTKTLHEAG